MVYPAIGFTAGPLTSKRTDSLASLDIRLHQMAREGFCWRMRSRRSAA
jgi:hypothetical protein